MLQIRLLGQFDVRADGKRVLITSRAGQSLLAYLVLHAGAEHRREKLAGMLWSDSPDETARKNLRQELWRIRKAIAVAFPDNTGYLTADEYTVTFNAQAVYWLDVAQLERAPAPAESDGERIARVMLYQGELLPGFYDDWVAPERDRVQSVYETRMRELLERLIAAQQWQTAVTWAEKWIALGQTPEAAYRALMVAYTALGDRAQAAAAYERCAQSLQQELGVEPADETRALYDRVKRGEVIASVSLSAPRVIGNANPPLYDTPPAPGAPPFKGLEFFDEPDANLFFGREQLIEKLADEVRANRFLAVVVGASGSGKSSVVRAGLIPAIRRDVPAERLYEWRVFVMTPTVHPLEALATVLTRNESLTITAQLLDDLAREPRSLHLYFQRVLLPNLADRDAKTPRRVLLVVDQFEELFTLCHDDLEREQFIDNLVNALGQASPQVGSSGITPASPVHPFTSSPPHPFTLVLTIRADFYAHLAQYPELRELVAKEQEYIGPMNADELRRAIEKPALENGWEFEPGLVDLILRDVGEEPGALPLLSHALLETWKRRSGHLMTLKGYHDAGGVRGAIALTAESTYQQLTSAQQNIARNIFLRLTELGEGTEDTRRRAEIGELATGDWTRHDVRQVLTLLADARLITTHENTAEVAHEALIREWSRLRAWLNEDREGLKLHRALTEATNEWELMERDASVLYRGARLAQAQEFAALNPNALNVHECAFLDASDENEKREAREREEQRERELQAAQKLAVTEQRANKRLRQRAIFLAGALTLALVLAGIALFFGDSANRNAVSAQYNAAVAQQNASEANTTRLNAEKEKRAATARELAAASIANLEVDPERSILLALKAADSTRQDNLVLPEAYDALNRAVQNSRVLFKFDLTAESPQNVAFSPDGTRLAANTLAGKIHLWHVDSGKETQPIGIRAGYFDKLTFSPDGTRLATVDLAADDALVAKIFDTETGAVIAARQLPLSAKQWTVSAFSPDLKRVAVLSSATSRPKAYDAPVSNGKITEWDIASGTLLHTFETGSVGGFDVTYSADGGKIAAALQDGTARVWDLETGTLATTLVGHAGAVLRVALSTDGTRIATSSQDRTARIWDAVSGRELVKLDAHSDYVHDVSFSRDGTRLLTVSHDHTGKIWDTATGKLVMNLSGHVAFVYHGVIRNDGLRAATSSLDGTLRVWDLSPSHQFLTIPTTGPLSTLEWGIGTVAYSPDGKRIATGLRDGRVKVWDAANGHDSFTLNGHSGPVHRVAFSPDGLYLASASSDGTAKIWDLITGKEALSLGKHNGAAISLSYAPDSKQLASGDEHGIIHIWDTDSGNELSTFGTPKINPVFGITYSHDGAELAVSYRDGTVTNWELATGKQFFVFNKLNEGIFNVAFSPDDSRIAFATDPIGSQVLDAKTGRVLFLIGGTRNAANQIEYSPDGKLLATAQLGENNVKLWDAATGAQVLTITGNPIFTESIAFSPDGTRLAIATDEDIRVMLLRAPDLVALAKTRVTRSLTQEECQKYLHVEECPKEN
jgi:WD40 repeat protein/DNA-binding SARP family transcriptional activator